jgi:hypothetical protein
LRTDEFVPNAEKQAQTAPAGSTNERHRQPQGHSLGAGGDVSPMVLDAIEMVFSPQ